MSDKKIVLVTGAGASGTAQSIVEKLKSEGHSVEVRESEVMKIENTYEPTIIETIKQKREHLSLKPHRGKHRTPQNKYR